jgi:hypothetical protein
VQLHSRGQRARAVGHSLPPTASFNPRQRQHSYIDTTRGNRRRLVCNCLLQRCTWFGGSASKRTSG